MEPGKDVTDKVDEKATQLSDRSIPKEGTIQGRVVTDSHPIDPAIVDQLCRKLTELRELIQTKNCPTQKAILKGRKIRPRKSTYKDCLFLSWLMFGGILSLALVGATNRLFKSIHI